MQIASQASVVNFACHALSRFKRGEGHEWWATRP